PPKKRMLFHAASSASHASAEKENDTPSVHVCIFSKTWMLMWCVLFINITAGIMFIGFQSPLLQDILAKSKPNMNANALATAGATLIAVSSICNGIGRFFWGGISDKIGRAQTFRLILVTQVAAFIALNFITSPLLFSVVVCYVLLCYGGGFGTMPSFVLDVFGSRLMPKVYGMMLTSWSCAGVVGPQLAAVLKDMYPDAAGRHMTFAFCTVILSIGFFFSLHLKNTPYPKQ
ncbi:MAG: MFS transporter, partial [Clostridia bacterium]|nr:MFS transporter [Clostridia bacterium]